MKISTILILAGICNYTASAYSQNRSVSVNANNNSLKEVIKTIEAQSKYTFFYNETFVDLSQKITLKAEKQDIDEVLSMLSKKINLTFKLLPDNLVVITLSANQQKPGKVSGIVTDKDGSPFVGVTVTIKGTGKGVITDVNGNYSLQLATDEKTLVFSYLGMKKQEIDVNNRSVVNVLMEEEVSTLNEVVIQGYGQERKRDLIGSITKVSAKDIEKRPVSNILSALQGMVPGLEITNPSGTPGAAIQIRLRGINTPNSAGSNVVALILVDGIPVTDLSYLSVADVESTEVLKDASATAIYGSRGAGGVILISTKKGKRGSGPGKFSISAYTSLDQPTNAAKMLSTAQYRMIRKEGYKNDGIAVTPDVAPDLYLDSTVNTNWSKALYKTALTQDYQVNFSGGTQTVNYYISGGYRSEDATVKGNWYQKRANVRVGLDANLSDRLVVGGGASFSSAKSNIFNSAIASSIYYTIPLMPSETKTGSPNLTAYLPPFVNPNRQLTYFTNTLNNQFLGNFYLNYKIWKQLFFRTDIRYQMVSGNSTTFDPTTGAPFSISYMAYYPSGTYGYTNNNGLTVEPQLNYAITINKHVFKLLAGGSLINNTDRNTSITMSGYSNDILSTLGSATTYSYSNYLETPYKFSSLFGRLTYKYDEKYLVEGVFRRDGSSRFGSNYHYGNFWSLGAGWVFSEEAYGKNMFGNNFFGKLKATYGITGNDNALSAFQYEGLNSIGSYGGNVATYMNNIANPYLKWEQTSKLDIGLDLSMFEGRLSISANYFRHRTTGTLFNKALSVVTGFTSMSANLDGKVDNNGFELAIKGEPVRTNSFRWVSEFNFSSLKNKLLSLPGIENLPSYLKYNYKVGQPLALNWGFKYLGVDPATGLAKFEDVDKSGYIGSYSPDVQVLGKSIPDFYGGWNNTFSYKQLELCIASQFVSGIQKPYRTYSSFIGDAYNLPVNVLDRWQKPGDITNIPRAAAPGTLAATTNNLINSSSFAYCDASYFRVKNITFSYTIKNPTKLKLSSLKVFITGYNLFTITDYKGNDPENDASFIPVSKMYTVGLNIIL